MRKEIQKQMKGNGGITLIALVVTIVVLLILAGITISTLFGDNGIISTARKAADDTKTAEEDTNKRLENLVNDMKLATWTPTDQKYFTYTLNESTKTATITGIKEEYGLKSYYNGIQSQFDIITAIKTEDYDPNYYPNTYKGCITNIVLPYKITQGEKDYIVTEIGDNAFGSRFRDWIDSYTIEKDFESFIIPPTVTKIGSYAFHHCTGLTNITIPNSVTSIGNSAFSSCTRLTNITIPNSVTSIGYNAFRECTSLTNITIPSSVTRIGSDAFHYCTGLTSVVIESGVTSIENSAFNNCTELTKITIPNSVTNIENGAFNYCYKLKIINYSGTKVQWNSITKGSDNDYYLSRAKIHCTDGDIN